MTLHWGDAHRLGMLEASRLLRRNGFSSTIPVPVEQVADGLGLVVQYKPLPSLAGAYIASDSGPPGVLVNNRLPISKQRFTLAHEIGHHRFGHESSIDMEVGVFADELSDQERVAEAFAAWLLMPRNTLASSIETYGLDGPEDVYQLSLRLGVSYQALCIHLRNLKMIDGKTQDAWLQITPKSIKQGLLGTALSLGWNDVHVVSAKDPGIATIGAGDSILLPGSLPSLVTIDSGDLDVRMSEVATGVQVHVGPLPMTNPEVPLPRLGISIAGDEETLLDATVRPKWQGVHTRWFE